MSGPETPKLVVDIVIPVDNGKIVLIKRANGPFEGAWALPGGFVEPGETVEEAAVREAAEETGLQIELESLIGVYSDPKRDPRGHNVSVAFLAHPVTGDVVPATDAAEAAALNPHEHQLAFDHAAIISDAAKAFSDRRGGE